MILKQFGPAPAGRAVPVSSAVAEIVSAKSTALAKPNLRLIFGGPFGANDESGERFRPVLAFPILARVSAGVVCPIFAADILARVSAE